MSGINYLTQEGYDKMKSELDTLKTTGRQDVAKAIAEAREKGDLSENAEYHAAKVRVLNHKTKKEVVYKIVSEAEADLKVMKISATSPIGQGLLGKKVGDTANIQTPAGLMTFEILEITA